MKGRTMDNPIWWPVLLGIPPDAADGAVVELTVRPDGKITADVRINGPARS